MIQWALNPAYRQRYASTSFEVFMGRKPRTEFRSALGQRIKWELASMIQTGSKRWSSNWPRPYADVKKMKEIAGRTRLWGEHKKHKNEDVLDIGLLAVIYSVLVDWEGLGQMWERCPRSTRVPPSLLRESYRERDKRQRQRELKKIHGMRI